MQPLISIITVTYNSFEALLVTSSSLQKQSYQNFQWIIVDGDSSDRTKSWLKELNSPNVFWESEPDKGIYDAMNKGINRSTGKWLFFLNAGDELYDDDVLLMISGVIESEVSAQIIYGDLVRIDSRHNRCLITQKAESKLNFRWNMPICHQTAFIRCECFCEKAYNTDYKICADYDFFYSCFKKGAIFKKVDVIVAKYLSGGYSELHIFSLQIERCRIIFRQSHSGWKIICIPFFLLVLIKMLLVTFKSHLKGS